MARALERPAPWRFALGLFATAVVGTALHGFFAETSPEATPEVPSCVGCHSGDPTPPESSFSRFVP